MPRANPRRSARRRPPPRRAAPAGGSARQARGSPVPWSRAPVSFLIGSTLSPVIYLVDSYHVSPPAHSGGRARRCGPAPPDDGDVACTAAPVPLGIGYVLALLL